MMMLEKEWIGQKAAWKESPKVGDWGYARENVYPILLPAGESMEGMVHTMMLDLAAAYAIRLKNPGKEGGIVRVDTPLLESYGISREELHRQALKNMDKDSYSFKRLEEYLFGIPCLWPGGEPEGAARLYVLTNRDGVYGAAGLLNQEIVRGFTERCDCYILPASVHELLFVPADNVEDIQQLDEIVKDISLMIVPEEERLSFHSYFYDASADEVRLCR